MAAYSNNDIWRKVQDSRETLDDMLFDRVESAINGDTSDLQSLHDEAIAAYAGYKGSKAQQAVVSSDWGIIYDRAYSLAYRRKYYLSAGSIRSKAPAPIAIQSAEERKASNKAGKAEKDAEEREAKTAMAIRAQEREQHKLKAQTLQTAYTAAISAANHAGVNMADLAALIVAGLDTDDTARFKKHLADMTPRAKRAKRAAAKKVA